MLYADSLHLHSLLHVLNTFFRLSLFSSLLFFYQYSIPVFPLTPLLSSLLLSFPLHFSRLLSSPLLFSPLLSSPLHIISPPFPCSSLMTPHTISPPPLLTVKRKYSAKDVGAILRIEIKWAPLAAVLMQTMITDVLPRYIPMCCAYYPLLLILSDTFLIRLTCSASNDLLLIIIWYYSALLFVLVFPSTTLHSLLLSLPPSYPPSLPPTLPLSLLPSLLPSLLQTIRYR